MNLHVDWFVDYLRAIMVLSGLRVLSLNLVLGGVFNS